MSNPEPLRTEALLQQLKDSCLETEDRNRAAGELIERLGPTIATEVRRFGLQDADVADAVGDLTLKIVEGALDYDPTRGSKFRQVVKVAAKNWAREQLRKRARHRGADQGRADSDVQQVLNNEPDRACEEFSSVLSKMAEEEMCAQLRDKARQARQLLKNDAEREIVRLFYEGNDGSGMSAQDVAEKLGVKPSDVYQVTHRYRQILGKVRDQDGANS